MLEYFMGLKLELLKFLRKLFIGNDFFFFEIFNLENLECFSMFAFSLNLCYFPEFFPKIIIKLQKLATKRNVGWGLRGVG